MVKSDSYSETHWHSYHTDRARARCSRTRARTCTLACMCVSTVHFSPQHRRRKRTKKCELSRCAHVRASISTPPTRHIRRRANRAQFRPFFGESRASSNCFGHVCAIDLLQPGRLSEECKCEYLFAATYLACVNGARASAIRLAVKRQYYQFVLCSTALVWSLSYLLRTRMDENNVPCPTCISLRR